ncbi:murein biosynthesis integral membrane protein MurJ [Verminephrobacter eiseniae]|uniref:murein biosynthesis integral membrane protein MurJ n=1 Tax=Verminephrobacter eiseniae TaxID=364317 RepID=UPI002238BFDF|nr:murein biosynthesis integral membrane protein MurJ [Verminephrobacter eiseniae]MCW5234534.1 murein biosynthesis integral membrane protein MurJ [Verminephrobacter eiseniae]MCW5293889.1 murein biosynthesis integral membrane protein MurJ [Verminephrobacter eiseniae]MCW8185720.1 murein biosynthesis integral membrane protein MurJ [Verminephrobacter eiseniae]MCW8222181.1 murein biosynthesis integral membrane protein MurJ [Verminephrobacter eiseniae]MCW8235174.1 murein biosynthesis integral membra
MSLLKAASTVSLLTLASRVTGLAQNLLVASMFGANALTDAFNVAFRIPNLFRRLFAEGAFSQAFVPVLGACKAQQGEEATRRLIAAVATALAWVLLLSCVLGVLGAPVLVWALASGLRQSGQAYDAAVLMTRWMFPYIGFMSMVALSAGILNTWKHFAVPAVSPVLLNLSLIGAAWLGAPQLAARGVEPIFALAGGVMLGGLLQLAVQVPVLVRLGLMPRIGVTWGAVHAAWAEPGVRRVLVLMGPMVLGVGVAQISLMINTRIASYLTPGSVTWLFYADRLMEFPTALLGVALGVVLTPQLTAAKAAGDGQAYSAMLDWGLRIVVLLTVPCAVALLTFSTPLVATLFHHGKLVGSDVGQIAVALSGYGAGLLGLVAIKVLAPGYYASQDMGTPVRIALAVLVITQLLNLALVPLLAHAGLALSIALGALINALWLLAGLLRRGSYRPGPGWGRFALQVLAASALLALLLVWGAQHFDWIGMQGRVLQRVGWLAALLAAAALLYFGALWAAGLNLRQMLRR